MAIAISNISKSAGTETDPSTDETSIVQRTNYLIAIGIDSYANSMAFPYLGGSCKRDCRKTAVILCKKYGFKLYKCLYNAEATIAGIRAVLEKFKADPEKNNSNSNLIIYYSGHGHLLMPNEDIKLACLVAQDFTTIEDQSKLFIVNSELFGPVGFYQFLKVQHFAFISDACFSGGAVNYSNLFEQWTEKEKGVPIENERSCWAFCSGRTNEKSNITNFGDNSDFTKAMLAILENNLEPELLIGQLKTSIEKYFLDNKQFTQTPFCERLGILKKNTGQFVLRAGEEILKKEKKKKLLPDKLKSFDYKNQREKLGEFEHSKTNFFTIVSGPADAGLNFLNKMVICNSSLFPGKDQPIFPVEVAYSSASGGEQVIELFNLALRSSFTDENALRNYVKSMLASKPLSIEFKFRKKQWLNEDKRTLMSNTARFIQTVHGTEEDLMPLFIFIIDPDATDYETFSDDPYFNSSSKLIMPSIDLIDRTILLTWYDSIVNKEFEQLFGKVIATDIATELTKTKLLPGQLIRQICKASGCNDVAIQLLDD